MVALAKRNSAGSHRTSVMINLHFFLYGMKIAVLSQTFYTTLGYGKDGADTIIPDSNDNATYGQHFQELATESPWEPTMLHFNFSSSFHELATDSSWKPTMLHYSSSLSHELATDSPWEPTMLHYNSFLSHELATDFPWEPTMLHYNSSSLMNWQRTPHGNPPCYATILIHSTQRIFAYGELPPYRRTFWESPELVPPIQHAHGTSFPPRSMYLATPTDILH